MKITIPELSLVMLVGASGSGKSSFGRKHFLPTEVISSDFCRGLVSDDDNDQSATGDAFDLLHTIIRKRLTRGKLTVVDATNVQPEARKSLIALAREYHVFAVAIVFDLPEKVPRAQRISPRSSVRSACRAQSEPAAPTQLAWTGARRHSLRFQISLPSRDHAASIERQPLWNNRKSEHGPLDIIGDVHGCFDELLELLDHLGYAVTLERDRYTVRPPDGRKVVFVGDLVDRGPGTPQVLRLVSAMVEAGQAFCVPGNHDVKLVKALKGRNVQLTHGLADSMAQLEKETQSFASRWRSSWTA